MKAKKATWAVGKRRLLKLAAHLQEGKLGHKKFDFLVFNADPGDGSVPYKCGYAGCAIGECPILFRKDWKFNCFGDPVLKQGDLWWPLDSAALYFGIDRGYTKALFAPDEHRPWAPTVLTSEATKRQVASSIRQFVRWWDKERLRQAE